MEQQITKEILINELIEKYPEIAEILMGYGLHCAGCHFSNEDTLELGAKIHGLNDEDIEMIIKDVNAVVEREK
ncbi:MAG TPA: DUF1858 domain-containing protein [Candidatus Pacearchaeota archaeon]|nr:DUF1858 domain-containing protein [Candidatus Pacearchaeota archaeon]